MNLLPIYDMKHKTIPFAIDPLNVRADNQIDKFITESIRTEENWFINTTGGEDNFDY